MSKTYIENVNIFYPQNSNLHYTEKKAMIIALKWLINACEKNESHDFRQELRALLSTTSGKIHTIANMIRYVLSLDKDDSKNLECIGTVKMFAETTIYAFHQ